MDDAEYHRNGYTLDTCGFRLNDIKLLQVALFENWALDTSIHSRNRLYIKANSKSKFIELIKPHFHSSMLYKIK